MNFLAVVFLVAGLAGSSHGQETKNGLFADVDVQVAQKMIQANMDNPLFVLLDTRTQAEYKKSHLDNAVFYDYDAEDFWEKIDALDKTKTYLVYCYSGGRSGKTVDYMKDKGFREAHNMTGGLIAWKKAGYPVIRD